MSDQVTDDIEELPLNLFNKALKKVNEKPGDKYKFIVRGGFSLKNALFTLFSIVWKTEQIPDNWYNSELVQLWKKRSSKSCLDMYRHIHLKDDTAKLFGQIVTMAAEENMVSNMTKF